MAKKEEKQVQGVEQGLSTRFTNMVIKEFGKTAGESHLTEYQKKLAQHMFIKIDATLTDLEMKRLKDNKKSVTPYTWGNINMQKLAIDTVYRVELGLDALIGNHIWPIPYLNGRSKRYDLDLRIGYEGKKYYRQEMAVEKPVDVILELVHENDKFSVLKKDANNVIESYNFKIAEPFNRGKVVGGFGYIVYQKPEKNKLIIVSEEGFLKSKKAAMSKKFWDAYPDEMRLKTLVHRVTDKIAVDPKKVNAGFFYAERQDNSQIEEVNNDTADREENANTEFIDIQAENKAEETDEGYTTPEYGKAKETAENDPGEELFGEDETEEEPGW